MYLHIPRCTGYCVIFSHRVKVGPSLHLRPTPEAWRGLRKPSGPGLPKLLTDPIRLADPAADSMEPTRGPPGEDRHGPRRRGCRLNTSETINFERGCTFNWLKR